ncbi:MAG: hypothetical protein JXR10_04890 [Cyclobacteriaceae bacterium]
MIYSQKAYTDLHDYLNLQRFETDEITMCFELIDGKAICLPYSPCGGISVSSISEEKFLSTYELWENELKSKGIETVEITLPIEVYDTIEKSWLISLGYEVSQSETAHYLPLSGKCESRMHEMQLRKLKKLTQLRYQEINPNELPSIYRFIQCNRSKKDIPLNVSLESLEKMFAALPEHYQIHAAYVGDALVACCIMVIPSEDVGYYFLPASSFDKHSMSPMVGLIYYMYYYYQSRHFRYLDLGISSILGAPQESLIAFKERMGGTRTSRLTYLKSIQ